jgi:predicted nucleic acid-binding protein
MGQRMSTLVYVDTNIYLDFLEDRKNKLGKPLGPSAFEFFRRAAQCEFDILISKKVLSELYGNTDFDKTAMLFALLKKKLKPVDVSEDDEVAAEKLDKDNKADALHAIIANKNKARYLVTRNKKHFLPFSSLVEPIYPDEI